MSANRGLLLDRDGVINVDSGYVGSKDRFVFLPGVFSFLRDARALGYRLAILTNQSGVARGLYTQEDFNALTAHMLDALAREGIAIDLTLGCFAHPKGRAPYAYQSFWRKPNPGMVLEAVRKLYLDPARSAFLGDALTDMQAAQSGGIAQRLWLTQEQEAPDGAKIVKNFDEAFEILRNRT